MPDIATILFFVIAIVMVGAAFAVIFARNIVHSALYLAILFAAAAGIYILLSAEFIAIIQVLVYAGAVSILILFAIMLTRNSSSPRSNSFNKGWVISLITCVILGAAIIVPLMQSPKVIDGTSQPSLTTAQVTQNNVARIGQLLYSPLEYSYVLPFEIASFVLLAAIMGAIVIGRRD